MFAVMTEFIVNVIDPAAALTVVLIVLKVVDVYVFLI
jgi:hypothetical protein